MLLKIRTLGPQTGHRTNASTSRVRGRRARRPVIEALEGRDLMAISLSGDVYTKAAIIVCPGSGGGYSQPGSYQPWTQDDTNTASQDVTTKDSESDPIKEDLTADASSIVTESNAGSIDGGTLSFSSEITSSSPSVVNWLLPSLSGSEVNIKSDQAGSFLIRYSDATTGNTESNDRTGPFFIAPGRAFQATGTITVPIPAGGGISIGTQVEMVYSHTSYDVSSSLTVKWTFIPEAPVIKMDSVQFNGDTSEVDFDYETTGSPGSFPVELFQSPTPTFDPATAIPVRDPGTQEIATQTVTPQGANSPQPEGVFTFSQPLLGDPLRPYLIAVADPYHELPGVDETNNSADVLFPTIQLVIPQRRLTLMQDLTFQTTVSMGPNADSYSLQVERQGTTDWTAAANTDHGSVTQRLAGYFNVRATATINGVVLYSKSYTVEAQFPDYNAIVSAPQVATAMKLAWAQTIAFAVMAHQNGSSLTEREEGFWITLDTSTGSYGISQVFYGTPTGGTSTEVTVDLGQPPRDIVGGTSAIYTVASFHTHPPLTYAPDNVARTIGPSDQDIANSVSEGIPGIVYDYTLSNAFGFITGGWPLDAAAGPWGFGLARRATPR